MKNIGNGMIRGLRMESEELRQFVAETRSDEKLVEIEITLKGVMRYLDNRSVESALWDLKETINFDISGTPYVGFMEKSLDVTSKGAYDAENL